MAVRGRKPKPTYLHVVEGTLNATRHAGRTDGPLAFDDNGLAPPKKLTKRQQALWDRYVRVAPWLTQLDEPKAYMWVLLHEEFERAPKDMTAGKISQLRALGSELGLDPATRARLGATPRGKEKDAVDEYFPD